MANFSTLFPNLQLDLDYSGDGTTANATSSQISTWARGGDTSVIPLSKLPALTLGHTHTYTSTATTHAAALAAFRAAFNAAGTASGGITVAVGTVLNAGDILILTNGSSTFESYLYTGDPVTADAGAGNAVAEADFIDITNAGDGVTQVIGGTNLNTTGNVTEGNVTVNLDTTINGIAGINRPGAGQTADALEIGNDLGTRNTVGIHATTLSLDAGSEFNVVGGSVSIAGANNQNVALEANGSGELILSGNVVDVTASSTLELTSNRASGVAVDIDATQAAGTININAVGSAGVGSIVVDAGNGELRVGGEDIQNGTASVSRVLGIGANGQLTTANITVGGGAYTNVITLSDADGQSFTANVPNVISDLSQGRSFTVPATQPLGTWIKIINHPDNTTANTSLATVTLSGSETFLGATATPGSLVLNDSSANFEIIKIVAGDVANSWAVIAS